MVAVSARALADGPYLANGVKVGEVSQDSAVVWARLTAEPKRREGIVFKGPLTTLPADVKVDDLEGAVPGAPDVCGCASARKRICPTPRRLHGRRGGGKRLHLRDPDHRSQAGDGLSLCCRGRAAGRPTRCRPACRGRFETMPPAECRGRRVLHGHHRPDVQGSGRSATASSSMTRWPP